jgi:hypothetical protein
MMQRTTADLSFLLSLRIGEKFLDWTDEDPSLDTILESVSLYWLTETFPRCIYPYRGNGGSDETPKIATIYPPVSTHYLACYLSFFLSFMKSRPVNQVDTYEGI